MRQRPAQPTAQRRVSPTRRRPRVQRSRRHAAPFQAATDGFAALMEAQWERELEAGAIGTILPLVADTWEEW